LITGLSNAIKAREAYEDAHLKGTGKGKVVISGGDKSIIADPTVAAVFRGFEVGARNELNAEGLHATVHEVYVAAGRKDMGSGTE
jgi:hypothetical protein